MGAIWVVYSPVVKYNIRTTVELLYLRNECLDLV